MGHQVDVSRYYPGFSNPHGWKITTPGSFGIFGDGKGIELSDSRLKSLELYPELASTGSALTGGNVAYGLRNRFLINLAQTANVSLYATQGQLRVKANMAAGVHAGLFGYFEQSGTVVLSSSGSYNAACNLAVETSSGLTINSGVNLAGCVITSLVNSSTTNNGNLEALIIRKAGSSKDWELGINIDNCTTGITIGSATDGIVFDGTITSGKAIDFGDVTLAAGSNNNLFSYGDSSANKEVTITDYFFPVRMNVESVANPGTEKLASLFFLKFNVTTAAQANLDVQGIGMTVNIEENVGYAHAVEGLVDLVSSASTTTGTLIGGKFTLELSSGAALTTSVGDNPSAVLALLTGTGTYSGGAVMSCIEARKESATTADNGLWVNVLTGATLTNGVHFGGAGTITHAIRFDSSVVTVGSGTTHGGTGKTVRCDIDGTDYFMILSTSPS